MCGQKNGICSCSDYLLQGVVDRDIRFPLWFNTLSIFLSMVHGN